MEIGNKRAENVIVTNADGEVLAVISDAEIVEKNGICVTIEED